MANSKQQVKEKEMTASVTNVYLHVVEDVINNVRADFQSEGVDDNVLNELQALWELKMVQQGAIQQGAVHEALGSAPLKQVSQVPPTPILDMNVPFEATDDYEVPSTDMNFPQAPALASTGEPVMFQYMPPGPSEGPVAQVRDTGFHLDAKLGSGKPSLYMQPPAPWMNQKHSGVELNMNETYDEDGANGYSQLPHTTQNPPPVTKDFLTMSTGKRKYEEIASSGYYLPQRDGAGDVELCSSASEVYDDKGADAVGDWTTSCASVSTKNSHQWLQQRLNANSAIERLVNARPSCGLLDIAQVDGTEDSDDDGIAEDYNEPGEDVRHVATVKNAVDDRCVPTVGGRNKRKRAPRGPAGRNLKAKVECVNEDEAKVDSAPAVNEEVSGSRSRRFRKSQVLRKEEDKSGTENDESQEAGVNSKEQEEKRRGSSRLKIRPSKFRENLPVSSSKVKGESKSTEDNSKSVEVVLSINTATPPTAKPVDDNQSVQLMPSQVDTRELIARIFSKRKENKLRSTVGKESKRGKEASTSIIPKSPDRVGLKVVLLALKRVMRMKEADPFNKPVDPVKLGIPDYLEVVKRPMDLGTIRDRLEKGEVYNTVDNIFEDVALVWSNCRQYNDDGDPIMGLLQNLESTFNKLCLAAGFPFHATNAAEANSEKPKGEDLQQQKDQVKVPKKKKEKVARPDAGALLKTKVKRSAPVYQVMAESKARERKDNAEELNLGDLDRDVKNAVESSSGADKQVETPQAGQGSEDEETHDGDQEPLQGPMETPPVKEEESAPARHHRKSTNSQHVSMPAKIKRPNGHSTLTHRQGCLCVVCVGRRKREAKLRKSGGAHSKSNKSAKKKSGGPNVSGDMAAETEEGFTFAEDGEDAVNGYPPSDNVQGYTLNNYQLPLRKLDPYVVEMSRILLGSKPGSIWNRPRSLGYAAVNPLPGRSVGIADAISLLSKSR